MEVQKKPPGSDGGGRGSRAGADTADQITHPTKGYGKPIRPLSAGQSARRSESRKDTQVRIANLAARGRWGEALALAEGRSA